MRSPLSFSALLLSTIIIGSIIPGEAKCPLSESAKNSMKDVIAGYCRGNGFDYDIDEYDMPMWRNPAESDNFTEQFQKFGFIPQIINRAPRQLLVAYKSTYRILAGNYIPPFTIGYLPRVYYEASPGALYTMILLNVDVNFVVNRTYDQLVLNLLIVNIPGNDPARGDTLLDFQPVLPTPGAGAQRYVAFLYEQRRRINVNLEMKFRVATTSNHFQFRRFVRETNLGDPLAGNFFLTSLSECSSSFIGYC